MYVRKADLFISGVLIMYIVFFALSPPAFVNTILSHPIGVASSFGVAVFTAMYYSRAVGGLMIIALLASMTQTTEHMTQQERSQIQSQIADTRAQISTAQASTAPDKQQRIAALNTQLRTLEGRLSASGTTASPPSGSTGTPSCPSGHTFAGGSGFCIPSGGGPPVCPAGYTRRTDHNGQNPSCVPSGQSSSSGTLPPVIPNTTVPSGQTAAGSRPVPRSASETVRSPPTTPPPPSTSAPPRAVAACNIENFASF